MSYLHCPTCQHAYNLAVQATCPFCPVPASLVDPTEDILVAAEQLAHALARATPAERDAAAARMQHLALAAPDAAPAPYAREAVHAIRGMLAPPAPAPAPATLRHVLTQLALAAAPAVRAAVPRLRAAMPRLRDAAAAVRSRVRAIAA
jgi:hypothetical protein